MRSHLNGRENQYWIPKLRQLTKRIIKKRYHIKSYETLSTGKLTKNKTFSNQSILIHRSSWFCRTYSLSKAIHFELVANQITKEFIRAFKRLMARRGVAEKIYLDNAKTFITSCQNYTLQKQLITSLTSIA